MTLQSKFRFCNSCSGISRAGRGRILKFFRFLSFHFCSCFQKCSETFHSGGGEKSTIFKIGDFFCSHVQKFREKWHFFHDGILPSPLDPPLNSDASYKVFFGYTTFICIFRLVSFQCQLRGIYMYSLVDLNDYFNLPQKLVSFIFKGIFFFLIHFSNPQLCYNCKLAS